MFIRTVPQRKTGHHAVQVVESYRNQDGKPRQRILRYLGCAPKGPALDELLRLAEHVRAQLREERAPALFPPETLAEAVIAARKRKGSPAPLPVADMNAIAAERRICLGIHEVFGELYRQLGIDSIWDRRSRVSARIFRAALWMRILAPGKSKRAHHLLLRDHGLDQVALEQVYRMMDRLTDERIAELDARIHREASGLLGGKTEVVFLDATTLSFASEVRDDLRKKGFSKDGKHQKSQVVLALLQSPEGLPLGYRLYPGDTTDVKTLAPLVRELRKQVRLSRVVVVADAGMASRENFETMEALGFDWVVAARLRRLSGTERGALAKPENWPLAHSEESDRDALRLSELVASHGALAGRRLVLRYSPKKARKDRADRATALLAAKKRLGDAVKGKGRAARYLTVDKGAVRLDPQRVAEDALFDGLHGVWTSLPDPPAVIRAHYAELWRIEHGFRVLKGSLKVRPMFHWTEHRVRAHVAICYLAFALVRVLRWRFQHQHPGKTLSEERIRAALSNVNASLVCDPHTQNRFLIPDPITREQRMLYASVGLSLNAKTTLVSQGQKSKAA